MNLVSHLHKTRCGVFQFRIVLPVGLSEHFGKKEIRKSLGTKDIAEAKQMAYRIASIVRPMLDESKRSMKIDPKDIKKLIAENLVIEGGKMMIGRLETSSDPEIAKREIQALSDLAEAVQRKAEGEDYEKALKEKAFFEAFLAQQLQAPKPSLPTVERPKNIKEAIQGFLLFKKGAALSTRSMYQRRLRIFSALAGGEEKPLHSLSSVDCVEIVEAMNVLPAHISERNIQDAKTMLAGEAPEKTIQAGTIRDHLTLFASFMDWAIKSKHYAGENPFVEVAKPKGGTIVGGAEPFSQSELESIFAPEGLQAMKRPHQFWGPLLGLMTGARSNELAQLRLCDFVEEGGVRCLRITHDETEGQKTRTKNSASERLLPIHPRLWDIGLEQYLQDLRKIGAERLFPNLPADVHGKREKYLSRDFNELHLKSLGIWKPRKKVFHSFRDTVTDAMSQAEVKDAYIEQWLGHSTKTVTGQHYRSKASISKLSEQCWPAMDFPFLQWEEIRYEEGRWSDWLIDNIKP